MKTQTYKNASPKNVSPNCAGVGYGTLGIPYDMSIKAAGLVINFHTLLIGDCSSMTTLFQILLRHLIFELNSHKL